LSENSYAAAERVADSIRMRLRYGEKFTSHAVIEGEA
jgi:hypothetical protein